MQLLKNVYHRVRAAEGMGGLPDPPGIRIGWDSRVCRTGVQAWCPRRT